MWPADLVLFACQLRDLWPPVYAWCRVDKPTNPVQLAVQGILSVVKLFATVAGASSLPVRSQAAESPNFPYCVSIMNDDRGVQRDDRSKFSGAGGVRAPLPGESSSSNIPAPNIPASGSQEFY